MPSFHRTFPPHLREGPSCVRGFEKFGCSCADYAKAVEKAGSKATMTLLFAPTDAAFQNLEAPVTEFLSSPDNVEGLKAVIGCARALLMASRPLRLANRSRLE